MLQGQIKRNNKDGAEKKLTDFFMSRLKKQDEEIANLIEQSQNINTQEEYLTFKNNLNNETLVKFTSALAKLMDIIRLSQKISTANIIYAHENKAPNGVKTADSLAYVLNKLSEENIPAKKVQEMLNSKAFVEYSQTGHPTNPTNLEYSKKLNHLEQLILQNVEYKYKRNNIDDINKTMDNIISTKLSGEKKSVINEVEETLIYLDNAYEQLPQLNKYLQEAINKTNYAGQITLPKKLLKVNTWTSGDGDGNVNVDIDALKGGINKLKESIKQHYINDLKDISTDNTNINNIIIKLDNNNYESTQELLEDIELIDVEATDQSKINNLKLRINNFGFNFANIDIRHNSDDLTTTLINAVKTAGGEVSNDFAKKTQEEKVTQVNKWLHDDKLLKKLNELDGHIMEDETAKRIWGRLKVSSEYPEMSDHLIIAENKGAGDTMIALMLLKVTGHKIAEEGASMHIVPLTESVKELKDLGAVIESLLNNNLYREHVKMLGDEMTVMIARSDTVRRDGRGAEFYQEKALSDAMKTTKNHQIKLRAYFGGASDIARGADRGFTENPHKVGIIANESDINEVNPIIATIQGIDMRQSLSPYSFSQTLEGIIAQSLYADASANGSITNQDTANTSLDVKNTMHTASDMAIEEFNKLKQNDKIKALMYNSPWAFVNVSNLSSRPDGRDDDISDTLNSIRGEGAALEKRAITADKLSTHSGTYLFTLMGMKTMLDNIDDKNNIWDKSKSFRDIVRSTSLSLYQMDYKHAWQAMVGEKRPSDNIIEDLATKIDDNDITDDKEKRKIALAYLEIYALNVEKELYSFLINNDNLDKENIKLGDSFKKIYPNISKDIDVLTNTAKFAKFALADENNKLNNNPDNDIMNKQYLQNLAVAHSCAIRSPSAMRGTVTKKRQESQALSSYRGDNIKEIDNYVQGIPDMLGKSNSL